MCLQQTTHAVRNKLGDSGKKKLKKKKKKISSVPKIPILDLPERPQMLKKVKFLKKKIIFIFIPISLTFQVFKEGAN